MSSKQIVIITGNVGNIETRELPSGGTVVNMSVATNEKWKDKNTGELKEHTEWHRVTCFDGNADVTSQYVSKGDKIQIVGTLRTRKWQDKEGNDRYTTEIRPDKFGGVVLLGSRGDSGTNGAAAPKPEGQKANEEFNDVIPF